MKSSELWMAVKVSVVAFVLFLIVFTVCIIALTFTSEKERSSPNIIVILADDLGWNDVSFHGSDQIPTPNIDALAYNGVILKNHYVLPTCTPSRTAFLTGRYPIRAGMQGFPLKAGEPRGIPPSTKLLPEYLKKLGYDTKLIGKWHLGYYTDNLTPARRGFDTFYGYYNGYISYLNHTIAQSNETGYDIHRDNSSNLQPDWSHVHEYATDVFTNEAVSIIEGHDKNRPLYLQISHLAPHSGGGEEPLETRDLEEVNKTFGYIKYIKRRKFAGMMSALDESVGRVTDALSRTGLLRNSIIVFMADNGAQTIGLHENHGSNYPFRGLKFTMYEGGIHGVACVYSPLISERGRIAEDLMHMTDWLPTLYTAAGGSEKDLSGLDGVNQWPMIKSKEGQGRRKSLLVNIDEKMNQEAAISGHYKLIKGAGERYDGYFLENLGLEDNSSPQYSVRSVRSSLTNRAIIRSTAGSTGPSDMLRLRQDNKIVCRSSKKLTNCSSSCLFNLQLDPCETTDISDQHPDVVKELEKYIDSYRVDLMNQTNTDVDPKSYPKYFDGVWMPWLNV